MNYKSMMPSERYLHDAKFKAIVDAMTQHIINKIFTPDELIEAVYLSEAKSEIIEHEKRCPLNCPG